MRAVRLAEEGSRSRTDLRHALFDSIAHEFCTPLTAPRAAATLLMAQPGLTKKKPAEMCAIVDEESVPLEQLVRRAIEMAGNESASIRLAAQSVSLRKLTDRLLEEAHVWARRHNVSIQISDTLPLIVMDRDLVTRVLRHFLENAVRYSPPESTIAIAGRISDDRLFVTVADDRPGIDAAEQTLIFDRFFRGKKHIQRLPGTDMDLAIATALIEAHGGELRS
jgi:two-component system, OmpR family, sensor histidine kinase KdpD